MKNPKDDAMLSLQRLLSVRMQQSPLSRPVIRGLSQPEDRGSKEDEVRLKFDSHAGTVDVDVNRQSSVSMRAV